MHRGDKGVILKKENLAIDWHFHFARQSAGHNSPVLKSRHSVAVSVKGLIFNHEKVRLLGSLILQPDSLKKYTHCLAPRRSAWMHFDYHGPQVTGSRCQINLDSQFSSICLTTLECHWRSWLPYVIWSDCRAIKHRAHFLGHQTMCYCIMISSDNTEKCFFHQT